MVLMVFDIWYNSSMPVPNQDPPPGDTWPPPPAIVSPVALLDNGSRWFRPAFWLGLAFNVLACVPGLSLLQVPDGKEDVSLSLYDYPQTGVIVAAVLADLIGIPFAVWQMRMRRKRKQSVLWEIVGLLLCLLSLWIGLKVTSIIAIAKGFWDPTL